MSDDQAVTPDFLAPGRLEAAIRQLGIDLIGTSIGVYHITELLGAGGMGEVYRARDTKLHREVAIKVLPDRFVRDDQRLARFTREAQTLASLNHPNIAQIYGLEESNGVRALVMELVEGEDLSQRIARGAIRIDEALAIAKQIADALEAAHEQGIIHRDLKPANIMVRPDGAVKVLDFGLAKALETTCSATDPSHAPTITSPAMTTGFGVLLGTPAYMAPERTQGEPVNKRADIWAFGCVLYEMLTGRRAFTGDDMFHTLASVLHAEPDWTVLPEATPPSIRRLLRRSLAKDRNRRMADIADARMDIDDAAAEPAVMSTAARSISASRMLQLWPWSVAVVLAILLLLAIWKPRAPSTASLPPMRLDLRLGAGEQLAMFDPGDGALAVLSPDGQTLVYRGTRDSVSRLYVRPLASLESRPLPGTEGALSPFFSPDGQWIAFFSGGWLRKVAVSGGAPVPIASAPAPRGGTWGPDDTIVFTPDANIGLYRVAASGGTPRVEMTKPAENERSHRWASFLPEGNAVVFVMQDSQLDTYDDGVIEVVRLDTNERKILLRGGTFPRYLASGDLVFVRENTLFAVPFDARRLEVQGTPQPILYGVKSSGYVIPAGSSQVAFSSNGTVAYLADSAPGLRDRLVIVDRSGKPLFTYPETRQFRDPRFSPDGSRVAVQIMDAKTSSVHVLDVGRATLTTVTFDGTYNGCPVWSPDGERLAYYSDHGAQGLNIFLTRSDGTGDSQPLTAGSPTTIPDSFSSNGRLLAATRGDDIVVLSLADRQLKPFAATSAQEGAAAFSPNGQWIAYESNADGAIEVFVSPYPGPGGKTKISIGGGVQPVWTKDGRELVYLGGPTMNRFMAVEIAVEGNALRPGTPRKLFDLAIAQPTQAKWYDASADGGRFVVLAADADLQTHVRLVFNFFEEVRRVLAGN